MRTIFHTTYFRLYWHRSGYHWHRHGEGRNLPWARIVRRHILCLGRLAIAIGKEG